MSLRVVKLDIVLPKTRLRLWNYMYKSYDTILSQVVSHEAESTVEIGNIILCLYSFEVIAIISEVEYCNDYSFISCVQQRNIIVGGVTTFARRPTMVCCCAWVGCFLSSALPCVVCLLREEETKEAMLTYNEDESLKPTQFSRHDDLSLVTRASYVNKDRDLKRG